MIKILTNSELIKNYTIFHAYFCYLIDTNQADFAEELCEISWELAEEIKRRKIGESQIKKCIKKASLKPQDHLMVYTYIYPDLINSDVGHS